MLKLENASYHSVQNVLSSSLLSRNVKIETQKTNTACVVLHGCETWSLTLREQRRLRIFQNRVLKRILGPERDEETWEWRRLHKKELYSLCSSPNIIRLMKSKRLRRAGHVACMGDRRSAYRVW